MKPTETVPPVRGMQGFSLIEMLVVVGIMGTLAVVGVPKYKNFMANARQSEAKNNLSHIYTLETTYLGDNEVYGTMSNHGPDSITNAGVVSAGGGACPAATNPINFQLTPCSTTDRDKTRYSYAAFISNAGANFKAYGYSGLATNNKISGCAKADVWAIDDTKDLVATVDNTKPGKCD